MRLTAVLSTAAALSLAASVITAPAAGAQAGTGRSAPVVSSVSTAVDVSPFPDGVTRLYGADRYSTAVAVSKRFAPGVSVAYLAAGTDFPDGLTAAAAAALEGGPLLLTKPTQLPYAVEQELRRLKPARIRIVGGTGVVSLGVERIARGIAPTTRLSGPDRYATGLAVLNSIFPKADHAFLATGRGYADALAASGAAGANGDPVVLVDGLRSSVPWTVIDSLRKRGVARIGITGQTGVVSAGIETQLKQAGFSVTRYGGANRYDTAAAINRAFFTPGTPTTQFMASGLDFPDALAGAALAGRLGAPMHLTHPMCVHPPVADVVDAMATPSRVVLGGVAVVSSVAAGNHRCVYPRTSEPLANWKTSGFTLSPDAALPYSDRAPVNVRDTAIKLDSTGLRIYYPPNSSTRADHPVAYAQYGISALMEYQRTGESVWLSRAIRHGERLVQMRVERSGAYWFPYRFPWTYDRRTLSAPWYSGMAQGQALSLFVRLGDVTGEARWTTAADRTWQSFPQAYTRSAPWSSLAIDRHLYFEEYAGDEPPLLVLNGHLFALFGLYDYWRDTGNPEVARYIDGAGTTVLNRMMPLIRKPGGVSYYCVQFNFCQRSYWQNQKYHVIHSWQLDTTARLTGDARFSEWAQLLRDDWQPSTLRTYSFDFGPGTDMIEAGPGLDADAGFPE